MNYICKQVKMNEASSMTGDKRRQLPKDRAPTVVNQPPFADLERIQETRGVKSELFITVQFL